MHGALKRERWPGHELHAKIAERLDTLAKWLTIAVCCTFGFASDNKTPVYVCHTLPLDFEGLSYAQPSLDTLPKCFLSGMGTVGNVKQCALRSRVENGFKQGGPAVSWARIKRHSACRAVQLLFRHASTCSQCSQMNNRTAGQKSLSLTSHGKLRLNRLASAVPALCP
jgi:hypothetical protein